MEGQLRVNPQDLINTATDFSSRGQTVNTLTQEMLSLVSGLSGGWEGDASGAYTKKFSELSGDITQINNKIKEHAEDLQEMAKKYQSAEDTSTQEHSAMSSNLID
ncbi:MAG: WXG100 family type VII secretion target [Lachnospiraceae bacterium]|nr:WXG100 family type VII secretion target [Lachnospiraceae bacterium]